MKGAVEQSTLTKEYTRVQYNAVNSIYPKTEKALSIMSLIIQKSLMGWAIPNVVIPANTDQRNGGINIGYN